MTQALLTPEPQASSMRHVVELRDVVMRFGGREVLDHVSLAVAPQERLVIIGMIESKSKLAQLVSLGGWLRGTEALSALVLQNYSVERSNLIRQPALIDHLEKQLLAMSGDIRARPIVVKLLDGIRTIRSLVQSENGPPSEETVRKVHAVCAELVPLSSRRLD
jgi:ATPase subunit of ABC transporter with duplicated ATPase domains